VVVAVDVDPDAIDAALRVDLPRQQVDSLPVPLAERGVDAAVRPDLRDPEDLDLELGVRPVRRGRAGAGRDDDREEQDADRPCRPPGARPATKLLVYHRNT